MMRCSDRQHIYYLWHEEDNNGHCSRCGEIMDRRKHAWHVHNLRSRLREAEKLERQTGVEMEDAADLRTALEREASRIECCREQLS